MKYKISAHDILNQLIKSGMADISSISGCTTVELEEIRRKQGVNQLPKFYVDIMKLMGRNGGKLFEGTTEFYYVAHTYSNLKQEAQALLSEDGVNFVLSEESFVFAAHAAYTFLFFYVNTNEEDPTIYNYLQGRGMPEPIGTLSHLFLQEINAYKKRASVNL